MTNAAKGGGGGGGGGGGARGHAGGEHGAAGAAPAKGDRLPAVQEAAPSLRCLPAPPWLPRSGGERSTVSPRDRCADGIVAAVRPEARAGGWHAAGPREVWGMAAGELGVWPLDGVVSVVPARGARGSHGRMV